MRGRDAALGARVRVDVGPSYKILDDGEVAVARRVVERGPAARRRRGAAADLREMKRPCPGPRRGALPKPGGRGRRPSAARSSRRRRRRAGFDRSRRRGPRGRRFWPLSASRRWRLLVLCLLLSRRCRLLMLRLVMPSQEVLSVQCAVACGVSLQSECRYRWNEGAERSQGLLAWLCTPAEGALMVNTGVKLDCAGAWDSGVRH